ncbi:MAG TPA: glycosyltransferase family 39 protein [Myxococcaceae bacterium]|nr:glycosyltransferase family 39 protein [Myxococcaceae bacterium]
MRSPDAQELIYRFDEKVLDRGDVSPGQSRADARPAASFPAPALLVATAFVGCAWLSWRRLGSLIVDGGKELDVPRRLLEGAALYRDIFWNWGPLAPWVNAGLYGLFGVHSDTQMWAGLVTAALACLGLYLIARRFVGPFTSAWVAIAFLTVSAFAQRIPVAIFNFVAPYNFSATYGITLAIWSVLLLLHHARSGKPTTLAASAALAGLVALTKMEATFAVVVAHVAFLATVLPRPSRSRVIAWGTGGVVAAVGYLVAARLSQGHVWRSLVELLNGGSRFYITSSMGVREVGLSLLQVLASLLGWAVVLPVARWLAEEHAAPRDRRLVALAWVVLLVVPAVIVREKFFRAAPFLLAAGLVWIVVARMREGEAALGGRWREHLVVWAFALGALPRILLRTGVDHYGFYLLPPTLVCVAIGMTRYLAARSGPPRSPRILAIAASTVLAGVALDGLLVSGAKLTRPASEVRTARVWRLVEPGGPEAKLVPYLSRLPPTTVCAAVPDGAGLIFASGLTPPDDGMIAYIPMHLHGPAIERAVLRAWERKPPQVIVSWNEDQSFVFGYAGFGQDYGLELAHWISERYEVATEFPGPTALLVRKRQD